MCRVVHILSDQGVLGLNGTVHKSQTANCFNETSSIALPGFRAMLQPLQLHTGLHQTHQQRHDSKHLLIVSDYLYFAGFPGLHIDPAVGP